MHKPYQSAPLSDHHLRIGLLVAFANEVNRGLKRRERCPMGSIYVFDDKAEIHAPKQCPENWPTGMIRIYRESRNGQRPAEFQLRHFDPALNTAGYDAREGGSMDQQGIRFLAGVGFQDLTAHYLVVAEYEQLSFVPMQGHHSDDPKELVSKIKNLTSYDRRLVLEMYEANCIEEPYSVDDLEHYQNVPHTYHNWLLLNACIVSRIVTLRQLALEEHGHAVMRDALEYCQTTGKVLPVDVSHESISIN